MVEKHSHHLLGDVAVYETTGESVAPLVGCEMCWPAAFVVDLAGLQPAVQLPAVGAGVEWDVAGDVGAFAREQQRRPVRPPPENPVLLLTDGGLELFVDGDGGF